MSALSILRAHNEALSTENEVLRAQCDELSMKLKGQIKRGNVLFARSGNARIVSGKHVYSLMAGSREIGAYTTYAEAKAALLGART